MQPQFSYSLDHTTSRVDMVFGEGRLIVTTKGKGALDKLKTIDIPVMDLQKFAITPTIAPQHLRNFTYEGDNSYDSEFMFAYTDRGKLATKRFFVNSRDPQFQAIVNELVRQRPQASLLGMDPAEARKQIGVASPRTVLFIVFAILIGIPLLIGAIVVVSTILSSKH